MSSRHENRFRRILLVVDVQNDFCPGGALGVPGGDELVPVANRMIEFFALHHWPVAATQDWHPGGHVSFASSHRGKKIYDTIDLDNVKGQMLWPDHCIAGTHGAEFHHLLRHDLFEVITRKGTNPEMDSYSVFFENDHLTSTGFHSWLKERSLKEIFLCGLATDYCVYFSAMDALSHGYRVVVIEDGCRGVDAPPGNLARRTQQMKEKGVLFVKSTELLQGDLQNRALFHEKGS